MNIIGGIAILFVVALVVLGPVGFLVGVHYETGDGSQVGYVSAVEKSGLIWKTYTAYIKPTLESTQEDRYCVIDSEIVTNLEKASVDRSRVKVSHFTWLSSGVSNCNDETAIIKKVETI